MSIGEIRTRCAASVTEMVSGAAEYGRSQQIIRDRAELLERVDQLEALLRESQTRISKDWIARRDALIGVDSASQSDASGEAKS